MAIEQSHLGVFSAKMAKLAACFPVLFARQGLANSRKTEPGAHHCTALMGIGELGFPDFGHQKIAAARAREIFFGSEWRSVSFEAQQEWLKFLRGAHEFCKNW